MFQVVQIGFAAIACAQLVGIKNPTTRLSNYGYQVESAVVLRQSWVADSVTVTEGSQSDRLRLHLAFAPHDRIGLMSEHVLASGPLLSTETRQICRGDVVELLTPWDRVFQLIPRHDTAWLPEGIGSNIVIYALGWWPPECRHGPCSEEGVLVAGQEVVKSPNYREDAIASSIRGRRCITFSFPSHETVWFDAERPGAILRRELYRDGHLLQSVDCDAWEQLNSGLWSPTLIRRTICGADGKTQMFNTSLKCVINPGDIDKEFSPYRPAGSVELKLNGEYRQVYPGGTDLFDAFAEYCKHETPITAEHKIGELVRCALYGTAFGTLLTFVMFYCVKATSMFLRGRH
jgi:hypothetical protein